MQGCQLPNQAGQEGAGAWVVGGACVVNRPRRLVWAVLAVVDEETGLLVVDIVVVVLVAAVVLVVLVLALVATVVEVTGAVVTVVAAVEGVGWVFVARAAGAVVVDGVAVGSGGTVDAIVSWGVEEVISRPRVEDVPGGLPWSIGRDIRNRGTPFGSGLSARADTLLVEPALLDIGRTLGIIGPAPDAPPRWPASAPPGPGPTSLTDEEWGGIVPGRETSPAPKTTAAVTTAAEPPAIAPATGLERLVAPFSPDPKVPLTAVTVLRGNHPSGAKRPVGLDRPSARRAMQGSHSAR